jgi:hypothetical protein
VDRCKGFVEVILSDICKNSWMRLQ